MTPPLTDTIIDLLLGIHDRGAWDRLPILADALEDAGDEARAELVRLGCELAGMPPISARPRHPYPQDHLDRCTKHAALRRRERELIAAHGGEWTRPLVEAFGMGAWDGSHMAYRYETREDGYHWAQGPPVSFRRGLLHVEAPLGVLREGLKRMGEQVLWVGPCHAVDAEEHVRSGQLSRGLTTRLGRHIPDTWHFGGVIGKESDRSVHRAWNWSDEFWKAIVERAYYANGMTALFRNAKSAWEAIDRAVLREARAAVWPAAAGSGAH